MLVLYRIADEMNNSIRVAELSIDDHGRVDILILEHSHVTDSLAQGQSSRTLKRIVTPDEGDVFLGTVKDNMVGSTYWYGIDEESTDG